VNAVRALMQACPNNTKYTELIGFIDNYQQLV